MDFGGLGMMVASCSSSWRRLHPALQPATPPSPCGCPAQPQPPCEHPLPPPAPDRPQGAADAARFQGPAAQHARRAAGTAAARRRRASGAVPLAQRVCPGHQHHKRALQASVVGRRLPRCAGAAAPPTLGGPRQPALDAELLAVAAAPVTVPQRARLLSAQGLRRPGRPAALCGLRRPLPGARRRRHQCRPDAGRAAPQRSRRAGPVVCALHAPSCMMACGCARSMPTL